MFARHQLTAYSPLTAGPLLQALRAGVWTSPDDIENARTLVARTFEADETVLVDSGRSALQLALDVAVSARRGPRLVGLPAFQCFEVASAAVGADCRIALYDIDPHTLTPDLDSLERMLAGGVRVFVVAPLYGLPADWDAIAELANRHGAVAVEDAAQGHGGSWRGRRLGSLGALSVVSFGRGKGWTAGGGGAVMARGDFAPRLAQVIAAVGAMSRRRAAKVAVTTTLQWAAGRPSLYALPAAIPGLGLGETHYHAPTPPTALSGFSAVLVGAGRDGADHEAARRRESAARWVAELPSKVREGVPAVLPGGTAGYLRFPLRLPNRAAETVTTKDIRRLGIARSYPVALSTVPAVAERLEAAGAADFPGAADLVGSLVTLPTHSLVSLGDRRRILEASAGWAAEITD